MPPTSTAIAIIPMTPVATPTPFLHTVRNNDTMIGIAYQYGVSLAELQAANPGVDPHFMSVGMQLIIPISGDIAETVPTLIPAPVDFEQPLCYRSGEGGAWCIAIVRNDLETSVENIAAWIGLFTTKGENFANQVVYTALNLLRPGNSIPVMAYFNPPLPAEFETQGELVSGLEIADDDPRYVDMQVEISQVEISASGKQARVSGEVVMEVATTEPSQIWVLAVAYDTAGSVIGARKWESSGDKQFIINVFSLGGSIDHVNVLVEARP
jgi:LysM repeat protein